METLEPQSAFQNFNLYLGPYKWPLIILLIVIVGLALQKVYQYFYLKKPVKNGLDAILFWGVIAILLGLIGQFGGIWVILNSIQNAPDISPQLMISGFLSSYVPALFGFMIGLFALLSWWILRYRLKELEGSQNNLS